jgi:hypothetical protein
VPAATGYSGALRRLFFGRHRPGAGALFVGPLNHTMRILKRIGNVIEGLVFIVLSLFLQSIFVILLTMAVFVGLSALGLKLESEVWQWIIFTFLLVTINGIACWEYFCKRRAQVQLGKTSSVIFMMPRALDLIWNGSERITR